MSRCESDEGECKNQESNPGHLVTSLKHYPLRQGRLTALYLLGMFRSNNLFIGVNCREAVNAGTYEITAKTYGQSTITKMVPAMKG